MKNLRVMVFAAAAATMMMAGAAQATTVNNTALGTITPGTTTTDATGTRSTNPSSTILAGETPATNQWQQENVRGNGVVGITTDYARSGNGSAFFSTDGSSPSKADLEYYLSTPVLLSDFQGGSYDWFRDSASTVGPAPAPSYRLMLANAAGTYAGYGIFEPYENGPNTVPVNTWTTENITTGGSQLWWNNTNVVLPTACVGSRLACLHTIADVSAVNVGMKVIGFSTGAGSGWTGGTFRGAVDNFSTTFSGQTTTSNFEVASGAVPEPASWALMILGFGSAGAMLRRRKLATA